MARADVFDLCLGVAARLEVNLGLENNGYAAS